MKTDNGLLASVRHLSFPALQAELEKGGIRPVHAKALWHALYRPACGNARTTPDLPPPVERWLEQRAAAAEWPFALDPETDSTVISSDGLTRKFLLRLADGEKIETVLMGYPGRFTACLSTQAGCAMGCVFCATGQEGFRRHLRPEEIVAQVRHIRKTLRETYPQGDSLRNLVLMGMGEPLHNYDSVMAALEIIRDTRGLNIGPRRISISTVGVVPGILRLAGEEQPYNLAVSLHGATEENRSALVPASRRWPLAAVMAACREYGKKTGRRIFFAWTLIEGANDSPRHAHQLAALLEGIDAHINLIPLNTTQGYGGATSSGPATGDFQHILLEAGFPCTVRQRRGIDVAAGCGQLNAGTT